MTTLDNMPMTGITTYSDADVLCGRGGMAQKHVGNKTYRALVNLNKQLYASCRTTEKIKISRSIVAAIREQKGRFLEKEANSDTFYDIGDKKAVEVRQFPCISPPFWRSRFMVLWLTLSFILCEFACCRKLRKPFAKVNPNSNRNWQDLRHRRI